MKMPTKDELMGICMMLNGMAAYYRQADRTFSERAIALRGKLHPFTDPSVTEIHFDLTHEEAMTLDKAFNAYIQYLRFVSQRPERERVLEQAAALQRRLGFNSKADGEQVPGNSLPFSFS